MLRAASVDALSDLLSRQDALRTDPIPSDARSVALHARITQELLDRAVMQSYGKAVVLAGPPGAGKSRALDELTDLREYLRIDTDTVKTQLLHARRDRFAKVLEERLPDGGRVHLNELATLVHAESVALTEQVLRRLVDERISVIIEGTLRWRGQGPVLGRQLRTAGYHELHILAVEVPCSVAIERALSRWWAGRTDAARFPDGGRFTPTGVITECYPDQAGYSECLAHAMQLLAERDVRALPAAELSVHRQGLVRRWTAGPGVAPGPADL